jgi:hypothetical protein
MRLKTALGAAVLACAMASLAGCTSESNGPPIEGPDSTEERTYSSPTEEPPAPPTTPADACSTSGDGLRQPVWTDSGDVNVNLSPVFAGDPDMDDVSYDDTRADSYDNYSEEFDPTRLLVVVLKQSDLPLAADDLTDVEFQPAETESGATVCDDPLETDVRYIGTRDAGEDESAAIWEISSDEPFYDTSDLAKVTLDVRQAHIEAWPDRFVKRQEHVDNDGPRGPRRAPAFEDLEFYYENR